MRICISPRYLLLALLALLRVDLSRQYVSIELKNNSKTVGDKYEDNSFFSDHYASFPGSREIEGHVWHWKTFSENGCEYITPLPYSEKLNGTKWFALIEDIGACEQEMMEHLLNAGFDLVIGYTTNGSSSIPSVSKYLRNTQFPIVTISGKYAATLREEAATNAPSEALLVKVSVYDYGVILVGVCAGVAMFALVFCILFCCACYLRCRARRDQYTVNGRGQRFNYQQYAQARLARRELIESILRQLQELQGEERQHTPLGEEATRALPQKTFAQARRQSSTKETCAICVEEFQETDMTRVLPCKHFFHPACIDPWLTEHSSMCPLCKQSVGGEGEGSRQPSAQPSEGDTDSFGTPELALTDVTNSSSPPRVVLSTNADDSSSVSSDSPLLSAGQPV